MQASLEPVVAAANQHRASFEAFCRSLTGEELDRKVPDATWLVRDYIAHLATIDTWVGDWFTHMVEGTPWRPSGESGAPFTIDDWNEGQVVPRRGNPVDALLAEAAANRDRLWAIVDRFTAELLATQFDFRGTMVTFQRYLELWSGHDPAHAMDMLRALPEKAADPEVAAWIDGYRRAL